MDTFNNVKALLLQDIIIPVVWLIMTAALLLFLWGVVKYIWKGSSTEARADGSRHMLWGIVGMAIMLSVFGIMHFIFGTVTSIGGTTGINGKPITEPSIDSGFGANTK